MYTSSSYQAQLDEKISQIKQLFIDDLRHLNLSIFPSPIQHFRQRAEFRIWHERDIEKQETTDIYYAMFEKGQRGKANSIKKVVQLPVASRSINQLMPKLLEEIKKTPILISRLYQIDFLSSLNGEMLVSMIYHKKLDEEWEQLAHKMSKQLNIKIIGRSKKQKIILTNDFVTEKFTIKGKDYYYKQIENGFTQPNAHVCEHMLNWICDIASQLPNADHSDLLELYCGSGNFTLPLSRYFRKVLATEVAKSSIQAAKDNCTTNQCHNLAIARLSAQEFTQAINKERVFRRLQQESINIDNYNFSSIFVDPPRAGIDDHTLKMMQQFNHIFYISCNPNTLADNLLTLKNTHHIKAMALFDQFPYTHHIEMGVWLKAH